MIAELWFNEVFGIQLSWLIALAIGVGINVPLFVWVRLKKHLTLVGCFLAGFFGISLWMIGPLFYALLFTFFISSSILTKYRKKDKKDVQDKFEKGGERDTSQVLANGLAGLIFATIHFALYLFTDQVVLSNAFVYAFIAAIATTNADTWATEIGILSNDQPYWILNLKKKVERGTSGGISLKGTFASFIGSLLVATIGFVIQLFWQNPLQYNSFWVLVLFIIVSAFAGFAGAMIDSLFGATVQGFFRCQVCNKGTEKRVHCKEKTILQRGNANFRNDHVNFWASFMAGLLAFSIGCLGFLFW